MNVAQTHPSANNSWHICLSLPSPCCPGIPIISDTIEATQRRSLAMILAHPLMYQVLTGVRSSRAHRMWSSLHLSSIERFGTQQEAALERVRAGTAAYCDRVSAEAMVLAARAGHCSRPRCSMMPMAALERLWCSMAAIVCVVRLVVGGISAAATHRAAQDANGAHAGSW